MAVEAAGHQGLGNQQQHQQHQHVHLHRDAGLACQQRGGHLRVEGAWHEQGRPPPSFFPLIGHGRREQEGDLCGTSVEPQRRQGRPPPSPLPLVGRGRHEQDGDLCGDGEQQRR